MSALIPDNIFLSHLRKQNGAALMVMLVLIVIGSAAFLVNALSRAGLQTERDKITADALAQAKDALIGYSVKIKLTSSTSANQPRPGDLPCPDTDNDGISGDATYTTCDQQTQRIGRLPWKTLGLPDLRDSSGERLWYAVSNNFKSNTRTPLLNSDTPGSITIRSSDGIVISDASLGNGLVAVIFAPGNVIQRQGAASPQNRSCTIGVDCDAQEICSTTSTPKCNPINYLDNMPPGINTEDNADFIDNSATDGFIQGIVKDNNGKIIVNDQLLGITQDNIMQAIQKRVAGEVKNCLNDYATNNNNRYPWAVPLSDLTYHDNTNQLFGRIPDDLTKTQINFGGSLSSGTWGAACNTHISNTASSWWSNWRGIVFYGLADAYKPALTAPSCGTCLVVTTVSAASDKKFVVIVAGKMLSTQTNRPTNQSTLSNYLELPNSGGTTTFSQGAPSATFNDTLVFQ